MKVGSDAKRLQARRQVSYTNISLYLLTVLRQAVYKRLVCESDGLEDKYRVR